MVLPDLTALAQSGAQYAIRVTPNARQAALVPSTPIRISVTMVAEDGKATEAARVMLAKALGVGKSRLSLIRGAKSRDKLFRLD